MKRGLILTMAGENDFTGSLSLFIQNRPKSYYYILNSIHNWLVNTELSLDSLNVLDKKKISLIYLTLFNILSTKEVISIVNLHGKFNINELILCNYAQLAFNNAILDNNIKSPKKDDIFNVTYGFASKLKIAKVLNAALNQIKKQIELINPNYVPWEIPESVHLVHTAIHVFLDIPDDQYQQSPVIRTVVEENNPVRLKIEDETPTYTPRHKTDDSVPEYSGKYYDVDEMWVKRYDNEFPGAAKR